MTPEELRPIGLIPRSLNQRSLILKLILRCVSKLLVERIQTGHVMFFPRSFVEVCGKGDIFVTPPVVINALIGFKAVPQVH